MRLLTRLGLPVVGRNELALLAGVLAAAFGLRIWGAYFGLPHVYNADEGFEVYRAVRLGMGGLDFERVGKGGYYFLLFAEYAVYFVGLLVTGAVSGVGDFALRFVENPSGFWKIGRTTTAVLGTATVFLVWRHTRSLRGTRAALLAAWFLALSARHVFESHYISVDVPMTLFTFWAITMIVEDVEGHRRLRPWLFAFVAAYAVLNKLPAALLFIPYFVASWMRGGLRGPGGLLSRATWMPTAAAIAIYCVANPGIIFNFATEVSRAYHAMAGTPDPDGEFTGGAQKANLWLYYSGQLVRSQGPAFLALSVVGIGLGFRRRRRAAILHAAFVLPFFGVICSSGSSHLYYPRYLVPILPGLCVFAALALDEAIERLRGPSWAAAPLALVTALLVMAAPGVATVRWDQRMTRPDTRTRSSVSSSIGRASIRRSKPCAASRRSPSRSGVTSRATPTSRSARRRCSASSCRRISASRSCPSASPTSGDAGTSRCRRGFATTSTSRWAAAVSGARR